MSTADACRRREIAGPMPCDDKARSGGPEMSDARRFKALEEAHAKPKEWLAKAMLDSAILKNVARQRGNPPLHAWRYPRVSLSAGHFRASLTDRRRP
ncbi:hypothetical protein [Mesobacterium pallidum]|uniref:hypothetical protein n=1 Tax=Mesobacterium pallidum TaxID=2872037 RepID=UPI001EE18123|nr:hypothetical protein [Mesobacterium pallidum]